MKNKYIIFILFAIFFGIGNLFGQSNPEVPSFQLNVQETFKAGVNISFYESYWKSKEYLLNSSDKLLSKLKLAKQLGFTSIRLPIAFDLFLQPGTNTLHPKLLQGLQLAYQFVAENNMNLVLTYHYGKLYQKQLKELEADRIVHMWSQLIAPFQGKGYDKLFFGLYNEPRLSLQDWRSIKNRMMEKLRPKDLFRYWIVGSTNYNGIDAFVDLQKVPNDNKILYTFHFYSPYIFTHQGASWDAKKTAIKDLPYAFDAALMPPRKLIPNDPDMVYNFENYYQKGNKKYLEDRIERAFKWMKENQLPVICTEVGTIATIPKQYRENYFKDVMDIFSKFGIPAMVWDLDNTFTIIDNKNAPLSSISQWINSFQ